MAGFATQTSFAGHPSRSATAGHALTFNPDHLMGAGQSNETKPAPFKSLSQYFSIVSDGLPMIRSLCRLYRMCTENLNTDVMMIYHRQNKKISN